MINNNNKLSPSRVTLAISVLIVLWATLLIVVDNVDYRKREPVKQSLLEEYPVVVEGTTIEYSPTRMVVLDANICKELESKGQGGLIVATSNDNADESFVEMPKVGTNFELNTQAIIELTPNVVITSKSLQHKDIELLSDNGIKVVTILDESSILENIKLLLFGNQ